MNLTPNQKIKKTTPQTLFSGIYQHEEIGAAGQRTLTRLRESVDRDAEDHSEGTVKVGYEYWVRYYLEEFGDAFGIDIVGNLDEERPNAPRGDYRVRHEGQEKILEVEKDVEDFLKHGHKTDGAMGWDNIASIDLVFAASDQNGQREELDVPVVLADDVSSSDRDYPGFGQWYRAVSEVKGLKEAFYVHLLQAVYYDLFKGIPALHHIIQHRDKVDEFSFKMNKRYTEAIHSVAGQAVKSSVDSVLFGREESVADDEEFEDVRAEACRNLRGACPKWGQWDCPRCEEEMRKLGEDQFTYDADPKRMTEGQFADQLAAQQGGFFEEGIHGETITVTYCFDCRTLGAKASKSKQPLFFDNDEPLDPDSIASNE